MKLINDILFIHNSNFLDKKNFKDLYNMYNDKNYIFYTLEEENEVFAYLIIYDNYDSYDLFEIAIKPEFRRKGYSKILLDKIPKDKDIFLEVSENNFRAIKIYEKYGFVKISIRKKYYLDGSDAIIMKLGS